MAVRAVHDLAVVGVDPPVVAAGVLAPGPVIRLGAAELAAYPGGQAGGVVLADLVEQVRGEVRVAGSEFGDDEADLVVVQVEAAGQAAQDGARVGAGIKAIIIIRRGGPALLLYGSYVEKLMILEQMVLEQWTRRLGFRAGVSWLVRGPGEAAGPGLWGSHLSGAGVSTFRAWLTEPVGVRSEVAETVGAPSGPGRCRDCGAPLSRGARPPGT